MTGVSCAALWWIGCSLLFACGSTPVAPGDGVVLSWSREGGFAGFCDELKVTGSGDVTASTCRTPGVKTGKLSNDDLARLNEWRRAFGTVAVSSADPGSADSMTVKLNLAGTGRDQPTEGQRQQLLDFALRIYNQTSG